MLNKTLGLVLVFASVACGSIDRSTAVATAAAANCKRYSDCKHIGEGQTYASLDDCITDQKSAFNDKWSSSNSHCKQIESKRLDTCTSALADAACNSILDALNTSMNKCTSSAVCGG